MKTTSTAEYVYQILCSHYPDIVETVMKAYTLIEDDHSEWSMIDIARVLKYYGNPTSMLEDANNGTYFGRYGEIRYMTTSTKHWLLTIANAINATGV